MTIRILVIVTLLISGIHAKSQQTYLLNLDESIAIAKMKSLEMLSLKQDLKISEANLKAATANFKTRLDLDMDVPNYSEGLSSFTDSSGTYLYSSRKSLIGGELILNQPLPTDGNIYLRSGMNSTVDYNDDERLLRLSSILVFDQPINALYYNKIKSGLKLAKMNYDQTISRLKREELNMVYSVSQAFYSLLMLQKREEIARMSIERAKEAYKIAKNKYDAGLIREVEALQTEVDLAKAQNDYDMSIINQQSSLNDFKELIGISLQDNVALRSTMEYSEVIVDPRKAVELAMANRLEILERDITIERTKLNIKQQKSEGMISGNINASYELAGYDESPIGTAMGTSFNNSYSDLQDRPNNFGIGLKVSIPIIDWGRNKAKVQSLQAQLQQNVYDKERVTRGIESEVLSLVANLNSSLQRLKLLEKNIIIAEKSFEITRMRFSDGDIDSQALALENERLNTAYQSHLSAYISYNLQLADLMRKTFYDFVNDKPVN